MTEPYRLLVLGASDSPAAAIGARLTELGMCAPADGNADAVLIDGTDAPADTGFLDLADDAFDAQVIAATIARVAMLQNALARAAPAASIVVIGTDAHLGHWNATAQSAASAALLGIVRSVAMEYGRHGIRANMIALPLGTTAADITLVEDAARQTLALFGTPSITGESILIDDGANLKFRQAKRR